MSKGKKVKNFEIDSLILSDTIHAPQNKFTAKKWHQNIIKKPFSEKRSDKFSRLKYSVKLFWKLKSDIKK